MRYWPDGEPIRFYKRDGTPYPQGNEGVLAWEEDMINPMARVIEQDVLTNGYQVSTVWLGLDHGYDDDLPPLIFETLVFDADDHEIDGSMRRYSTEQDAIVGHIETVDHYAKK